MTELTPAECYDALAAPQYSTLGPQVTAALKQFSADATEPYSTAIDLGAGTGLSTQILAGSLPTVDITSCEPDSTLRPSLMTRIVCFNISDRVTPRAWTAQDLCAQWDQPVDVFLALNMMFHLPPDDRNTLFSWLADHLTEGGVAIVGPLQAASSLPAAPQPPREGEVQYAKASIGRLTYEGLVSFAPGTDGDTCTTLTWRVREGEDVIGAFSRKSETYAVTLDDVSARADKAGLSVQELEGGLIALTINKG